MKTITKLIITLTAVSYCLVGSAADDGGSTIMTKAEVDATLKQGLANLEGGSTVSDIVMRHIGVGEENMGVSVVQRSKVEANGVETGIAHVHLDEIYYIVAGEGTMVTGGEFVDKQTSNSALLGPMERGEIRGGVLQQVKPGDIAIIPKGMPHGWHEMTTDTISYIIFRGDPDKVMDIKSSAE
ncbi:MAG: cupin domain-containing protein [Pseudohongiellaceae bacterium]